MAMAAAAAGMAQQKKQRVLWKPTENDCRAKCANESSLEELRQTFTVRPPRRTLFQLCANAVVVVQEFSLTSFLLARHKIMLLSNSHNSKQKNMYIDLSTVFIVLALLTAIFFSARADPSTPQQDRITKITQRSSDAALLALLLRWMAGVLQSLTASYSSDTVEALSLAGMTVHLLFCDYSYANGRGSAATRTSAPTTSNRETRPPFLGGIHSLNAALFSTTLLVSRLPDSLSAYLFLALAILVFAHYPATRHAISASYPAAHSVATWLVTAFICASTIFQLLVLEDSATLYSFVGTTAALGLFFPAWKYVAQNSKVLLRGPWDIPTTASMQLDYTLQPETTRST